MLMEQTPSQQNWQPYNALKRPGVMRLWSWQAVARGADTVMFFQLRRSIGACEKFHGAVIEHAGHEHTRVFREVAELGEELGKIGDRIPDARVEAKVAIVYDWENRWAINLSSGPSIALDYVKEVHKYYDALFRRNIQVDMIGTDEPLDNYDIVIAPVLYMVKPGYAAKLEAFVGRGGTFVTTFFSGIVDERDIVRTGGYPGELRRLLGIWAEEIDALPPDRKNRIVMTQPFGELAGEYECSLLFDLIHPEGAETIAVYGDDFYAGMPVVTVNRFGSGQAWYVASSPEPAFLEGFLYRLCADKNIRPLVKKAPEGVECSRRVKDGRGVLFLLNHNAEGREVELHEGRYTDLLNGGSVEGRTVVPGRGVRLLGEA
jgi:beta-galactosidase